MDSELDYLNKKLSNKSNGSSSRIIYIITGILLIIIIAVVVVMVVKKDDLNLNIEYSDTNNRPTSSITTPTDSNNVSNGQTNRIPVINNNPERVPNLNEVQTGLNLNNAYLFDRNQARKPEVFNISENIYTYNDAPLVCKAFDSELATYEQLVDAYKKGAEWCNYGWTSGKMALYPTQYNSWKNLQKDPTKKNNCGMPGINGGIFNNLNLLFGVNCYGVKPTPQDHELIKRQMYNQQNYENAQKVREYQKQRNNMTVSPFDKDNWSGCNLPKIIE